MKLPAYRVLIFLFLSFSAFAQQELKTFLLNKEEYKYLESKNLLISKAIENAFGIAGKQNYYKLDINQVDAWNAKVVEFKYFPGVNGDDKKTMLKSSILSSKENVSLKLRVSINKEKSFVHDAIKPYLNEKGSFILNIVVVGDPRIFITESSNKADFLNIIDEKSFAEKAFKSFFGDNPRKLNYNIVFDKMTACMVKNILGGTCNEQFDGPTYDKFAEKITSAEYSSAFTMFDIHLITERSSLTPAIESAIIKEADGTSHLKFYFCIPKDNLRAKKKKQVNVEGKIVSGTKVPLKGLVVYLRDVSNTVVSSQTTDNNGAFKFDKLQEGAGYSIYIDNSCKETVLFLIDKKDKVIGQFKRSDIGFEYKLLEADISKMQEMEEVDPSSEFIASMKGRMLSVTNKINPIPNQVVELKNSANQSVQSQKTDGQGNFEFKNVDPKGNYSIELPNYKAVDKNEKVYLSNSKNELVKEFKKDKNNKFVYKILPAEIYQLASINEEDVELTFSKQKSTNTNEIIIQDFVYYGLNSFQISPESKTTLDKIAKIVSENSLFKLEIISHTDSRGENGENQKLSEKRSESVMTYLVSKKIDPSRVKPVGMGESKPLNTCNDGSNCLEEEYKMNRRTEFKFYK